MDERLPLAPNTSAEGQGSDGVRTYLLAVASLGLVLWAVSSWVAGRSKRAATLHSLARELADMPSRELRERLFFFVISNQHKEADQYLHVIRQRKPSFSLTKTRRTGTLVHHAARGGAAQCIRVLVAHGADVNVCTEASGDSPLHVAATNGQLAAVQALLECGANINQTNATGWTALHQASVPASLCHAAANGRLDCVSKLISMGAAVDGLTDLAWPPLFAATNNGHYSVVSLLLSNGADVGFRDRDGNSVLHRAAINGSVVCLRLLLSGGITGLEKNNDGDTPIQVACKMGHKDFVLKIVERNPGLFLPQLLQLVARLDHQLVTAPLVPPPAATSTTATAQPTDNSPPAADLPSPDGHHTSSSTSSSSSSSSSPSPYLRRSVAAASSPALASSSTSTEPSTTTTTTTTATTTTPTTGALPPRDLRLMLGEAEVNKRVNSVLHHVAITAPAYLDALLRLLARLAVWYGLRLLHHADLSPDEIQRFTDVMELLDEKAKASTGSLSLSKLSGLCTRAMHRFVSLVTAIRLAQKEASYNDHEERERAISRAAECLEEVWLQLDRCMGQLAERSAGGAAATDRARPRKDKGKEEEPESGDDSRRARRRSSGKAKAGSGDDDNRDELERDSYRHDHHEDGDDEAEAGKRVAASSLFTKELAERVCPLIDGFYLVCSNDIPDPAFTSGLADEADDSAREPALTIRPRAEGRGKERATNDEDNDEGEAGGSDAEQHQPTSPAMDRFVRFIDRHAEVIRGVGRENIEQLVGSLEFILESVATHPEWRFKELIDTLGFERKRAWLRRRLDELRTAYANHTTDLRVSRTDLLQDSCSALLHEGPEALRGHFTVGFLNEEGVGAGVRREWFHAISQELFNPDNALFVQSAEGVALQPNPHSHVNADHLSYLHFAGRLIGMALFHEEVVEVSFTRGFYKHLLGRPVELDDLLSLDPQFHKNLKWILENNIDEADLGLTFEADADNFGMVEAVELVPNGRDVPVTEDNKREYVRLVMELKLQKSIGKQMEALLDGFHQIVPPALLPVFNEYELELLISGQRAIDVTDWEAHTEYSAGYTAQSPQVQWFWHAVKSQLNSEEVALLLQFVTGSGRVPLGGFAKLRGLGALQKFGIAQVVLEKPNQLPTASTCFNLLKLPAYENEGQLLRCLTIAIHCGASGFVFN